VSIVTLELGLEEILKLNGKSKEEIARIKEEVSGYDRLDRDESEFKQQEQAVGLGSNSEMVGSCFYYDTFPKRLSTLAG
jgi:hypothetical protein